MTNFNSKFFAACLAAAMFVLSASVASAQPQAQPAPQGCVVLQDGGTFCPTSASVEPHCCADSAKPTGPCCQKPLDERLKTDAADYRRVQDAAVDARTAFGSGKPGDPAPVAPALFAYANNDWVIGLLALGLIAAILWAIFGRRRPQPQPQGDGHVEGNFLVVRHPLNITANPINLVATVNVAGAPLVPPAPPLPPQPQPPFPPVQPVPVVPPAPPVVPPPAPAPVAPPPPAPAPVPAPPAPAPVPPPAPPAPRPVPPAPPAPAPAAPRPPRRRHPRPAHRPVPPAPPAAPAAPAGPGAGAAVPVILALLLFGFGRSAMAQDHNVIQYHVVVNGVEGLYTPPASANPQQRPAVPTGLPATAVPEIFNGHRGWYVPPAGTGNGPAATAPPVPKPAPASHRAAAPDLTADDIRRAVTEGVKAAMQTQAAPPPVTTPALAAPIGEVKQAASADSVKALADRLGKVEGQVAEDRGRLNQLFNGLGTVQNRLSVVENDESVDRATIADVGAAALTHSKSNVCTAYVRLLNQGQVKADKKLDRQCQVQKSGK